MEHTRRTAISILLALALIMSLAAGLTVTAAAESTLSLSAEGGLQTETSRTVRVKNLSGEEASARLILAVYDDDSRMVAVNAKQGTLEAGGYLDITVEYEQGQEIGKLRAFALDPNTGAPLCQAMEISGPFDLMISDSRTVSGGIYKDITIASAVGDGDVTLKGVTITGNLTVQGGGSNSVCLEDCTVEGRVVLDKVTTAESTQQPRLELTNTPVTRVVVQQPAIIEAADDTSAVDTVKAKADVEIRGVNTAVSTLVVPAELAEPVAVTVTAGTVEEMEVKSAAAVSTAENALVNTVTAEADVTVVQGKVNTVTVPDTASAAVAIAVNSGASVAEVTVSSADSVLITNNGTVSGVSAADADTAGRITMDGTSAAPVVSTHIHTWDGGSEITPAACTTAGVRRLTCTASGCGASKEETVPALGHDFVTGYTSNESGHWHVCSRCGDHGKKSSHTYDVTDCTQAAVCKVCDFEKSAGTHIWGAGVVTKAPTFTEPGIKTYTCTSCSEIWEKEQHPLATDDQLVLIQSAKDKGLLTYLPLNDLDGVTRLEMVKLMAAFLELEPEKDTVSPYSDCADLTGEEWSLIRRIGSRGIVAPYDDNSFRPNAVVTRGGAAEIFSRGLNRPQANWTKEFSDTAGSPFHNAVNNLYNLGLITGTSETTFSPADTADKETVLTWLINGKDWVDPRTPVPAITGASFVKTPAAIQLEIQQPEDMSDIQKFRLELKDSDGYWVDCGTFLNGVPIFGDGLNGTYTRIRITSIPKDLTAHLPAVFKMDCMLTVTNTVDSAPDAVTFSTVTNAASETGYCAIVQGLSADTDQVVVELAEKADGSGLRSSMAGNRFFDVTASGKSINITVFKDYSSTLLPNGYYRIVEVKQASVTDGTTASLTVNTRGGWKKVPAFENANYEPVSDLHFTAGDYPTLTWTIPSSDPSDARYRVYLSEDGGQTWVYAHSAKGIDFLPPYIFTPGTYNAVKVSTEIDGQITASCVSTDLRLNITRSDLMTAPSVTLAPVTSGGHLCTITGLTPSSAFTIFFGDGTGNYNRSMDFGSDGNGKWERLINNLSGSESCYIQEYAACSVDADGETASFTVSGLGGWQPVGTASAVTFELVSDGNGGVKAQWSGCSYSGYQVRIYDGATKISSMDVGSDTISDNLLSFIPCAAENKTYSIALVEKDSWTTLACLQDALEVTVAGSAIEYEIAFNTPADDQHTVTFTSQPDAYISHVGAINGVFYGGGYGNSLSTWQINKAIANGAVFDIRVVTACTLDGQTLKVTVTPASVKTYIAPDQKNGYDVTWKIENAKLLAAITAPEGSSSDARYTFYLYNADGAGSPWYYTDCRAGYGYSLFPTGTFTRIRLYDSSQGTGFANLTPLADWALEKPVTGVKDSFAFPHTSVTITAVPVSNPTQYMTHTYTFQGADFTQYTYELYNPTERRTLTVNSASANSGAYWIGEGMLLYAKRVSETNDGYLVERSESVSVTVTENTAAG